MTEPTDAMWECHEGQKKYGKNKKIQLSAASKNMGKFGLTPTNRRYKIDIVSAVHVL